VFGVPYTALSREDIDGIRNPEWPKALQMEMRLLLMNKVSWKGNMEIDDILRTPEIKQRLKAYWNQRGRIASLAVSSQVRHQRRHERRQ
jgi:hypothetical protein